jgi:RNA polymerase sigma-70 factor, ECF subfamily
MDVRTDLNDEDLVALCQKGERRAFEILLQRYMQKAFRIAYDFTRDADEAKDLSQEAFLRVYTRIKDFNGRSSFYTWLYRIVVNLSLDHHRRRGRERWEPLDETGDVVGPRNPMVDRASPDQEMMAEEASRKIDGALRTMPKNQRTAFLLRNHHGLSIADIARIMHTTEGTVRVHLHRAVVALKQSLAEPA